MMFGWGGEDDEPLADHEADSASDLKALLWTLARLLAGVVVVGVIWLVYRR